jgi:Na+-translocating ferredoxin:NAD+ oxidoreductase RnfG subunit
MTTSPWLIAPGLLALAAATQPAHAVEYYSLEQVQRTLFPAASEFRPRSFLLSAAQREAIAASADVRLRTPQVQVWEARSAQGLLGYLLVDAVTGKHESIDYAVALSPQGSVLALEIMAYRETYGGQIRNERWRGQFTGKTSADPVRLERDIKNISGATLSSAHVTDGVRRLLATFELAIKGRD